MVLEQRQNLEKAAAWMPAVADLLALGALVLLLPSLKAWLSSQTSGWQVLWLVIFYLFFCAGVYLIRKLEHSHLWGWQPAELLIDRRVRAVLAVFFGLLMMTTLAYQLGFFDSLFSVDSARLDEGESSSLFVYMPGALLGFSMLYVLFLAFPINANVPPGSKKALSFALLGPLLANSLLIFWVAQLGMIAEDFPFLGAGASFILVLTALALSFLPPRLLLQAKYPQKWAVISFAALILSGSFLIV